MIYWNQFQQKQRRKSQRRKKNVLKIHIVVLLSWLYVGLLSYWCISVYKYIQTAFSLIVTSDPIYKQFMYISYVLYIDMIKYITNIYSNPMILKTIIINVQIKSLVLVHCCYLHANNQKRIVYKKPSQQWRTTFT